MLMIAEMVVSLKNQLEHAKRKVEQQDVRQSEEGGCHDPTKKWSTFVTRIPF